MISAPSYVVQTWYIAETRGEYYPYRIDLATERSPRAHRLQLATRDPAIYQTALDIEGSDVRVVARWHFESKHCVCDRLLPDTTPPIPIPLPDERTPDDE